MEFVCDCPRRKSYTDEEQKEEREANEKKLDEIKQLLADNMEKKVMTKFQRLSNSR